MDPLARGEEKRKRRSPIAVFPLSNYELISTNNENDEFQFISPYKDFSPANRIIPMRITQPVLVTNLAALILRSYRVSAAWENKIRRVINIPQSSSRLFTLSRPSFLSREQEFKQKITELLYQMFRDK